MGKRPTRQHLVDHPVTSLGRQSNHSRRRRATAERVEKLQRASAVKDHQVDEHHRTPCPVALIGGRSEIAGAHHDLQPGIVIERQR